MKTLLGLMKMCTLPQSATNLVAHIQNAMNQILKEFVSEKNILFLDDISIKRNKKEDKDETMEVEGCRKFVKKYIKDVTWILEKLESIISYIFGNQLE